MLAKSLCVTPIILLAFAQDGADDKAKKDLERLQGAWVMHALEINGKAETKIQETFVNIKKDDYKTMVRAGNRLDFGSSSMRARSRNGST